MHVTFNVSKLAEVVVDVDDVVVAAVCVGSWLVKGGTLALIF
jgi:hypothetical protein